MFEDRNPLQAFNGVMPHPADVPITIETEGPSWVLFPHTCRRGSMGRHDGLGNKIMDDTQGASTTLLFSCPATGRTVRIVRDYKKLVSRTGHEWARVIWKRDCSDKDDCPVATRHGMSISYDWSKCEFRTAHSTKS